MMMRFAAASALLLLSAVGRSQQSEATFTGRVLDGTDSLVVSGVQVQVAGARSMRSDGRGVFSIANVPPGDHEISARMLGYAPYFDHAEFAAGQAVTRDIYLTRVPRLLSQMTVKGRSLRVPSGFEDVYRRAAQGAGVLLTREQIDSLNPRDVTGLLHEISAVHVNPNRVSAPSDRISMTRCRSMVPGESVNGQTVQVFFNGSPVTVASWLDEILDHVSPSMIQAVEVYNGSTSVPPVFQPACGVIAIWTRRQ